MTLRYLQTLAEVAVEHNSTIPFPLPNNLLAGLESTSESKSPVANILSDTAKTLAASSVGSSPSTDTPAT